VRGLRRYADEGRFVFAVTDVAVVLRRPDTGPAPSDATG
jgi:hypothetical protein